MKKPLVDPRAGVLVKRIQLQDRCGNTISSRVKKSERDQLAFPSSIFPTCCVGFGRWAIRTAGCSAPGLSRLPVVRRPGPSLVCSTAGRACYRETKENRKKKKTNEPVGFYLLGDFVCQLLFINSSGLFWLPQKWNKCKWLNKKKTIYFLSTSHPTTRMNGKNKKSLLFYFLLKRNWECIFGGPEVFPPSRRLIIHSRHHGSLPNINSGGPHTFWLHGLFSIYFGVGWALDFFIFLLNGFCFERKEGDFVRRHKILFSSIVCRFYFRRSFFYLFNIEIFFRELYFWTNFKRQDRQLYKYVVGTSAGVVGSRCVIIFSGWCSHTILFSFSL